MENKGCGEAFWYWSEEAEGPAECGESYEPNGLAICEKCSPSVQIANKGVNDE